VIVVRVVLALGAALLLHFVGTWLWAGFPMSFDPFLVVIVYFALRLGPVSAQLLGLAGGLLLDGVSGTVWGLHGFAGTLIGFGVSVSAQRVVVGQRGVRVLLFAAASAAQQLILASLILLVTSRPHLPPLGWSAGRVAATALAGWVVLTAEERLQRQWRTWQRQRSGRLRFR
jgi:rod shape-determining protein MreD